MSKKTLLVLAVSALLLTGCTQNSNSSTTGNTPPTNTNTNTATASGSASVNISNFQFSPATITVKKGTKITWTNNDNTNHTVTATDGSFNSGNLTNGNTFSQVFNKTGTFAYKCTLHNMMMGTVVVTD